MTIISDLIHNRELSRQRYVDGFGWVTSSDTFTARVQPKWTDSINRTSQITIEELFLNTAIFRDSESDGTFITTSYTFPTSGEAYVNARSGVDVVPGDRIIEPSIGRTWIVRGVPEYRDARLQHDEITACEASHLDKKWIEPIKIYNLTGTTGYDSLMNQYTDFESGNYSILNAFGAVAYFNKEQYSSEANTLITSAKGKVVNQPLVIYMDVDFKVDQNSIIELRGFKWKIDFLGESFFRVYRIGLRPFTERDAVTTLIGEPTQKRYI